MPAHPQGHPAEYRLQIALNPDTSPADGSHIPPDTSGSGRAAVVVRQVESLMTDDLIDEGVECIRQAMRANIWVRASGHAIAGHRFSYEEVPDHASRLAATRLALAYRFGNPVSASEIRLLRAPGDEPMPLTPAEKMRELMQTGLDLESIWKDWMSTVKDVTPAALDAPKSQENEPTAPIADSYLDI